MQIQQIDSKMTIRKLYLIILTWIIVAQGVTMGQQKYPVRVMGYMTGPFTLNLSDYGGDLADNIMLDVELQDPEQGLTREIKFRVTVLNNGNEVMYTNPSNLIPSITITQGFPEMFTGFDLANYFNPMNMVHVNGGAGSNNLPEGFNSFCIEVIDVLRNVPISDRMCMTNDFNEADPPMLILPYNEEEVNLGSANILSFSWFLPIPTPWVFTGIVDYEFKLVKLLPNQNPYDVFELSQDIHTETVMIDNLVFYDDLDDLVPGSVYAWRVRAVHMDGYDLIGNDGYSEIFTFTVLEPDLGGDGEPEPDSDISGCQGSPCDWQGNLTGNLIVEMPIVGDLINIGQFTMELEGIQSSGLELYSGSATIYVPFLYSKFNVSFDDIQIGEDNRMVSGYVYADNSSNASLIPSFFESNNTSQVPTSGNDDLLPDNSAFALQQYLNQDPQGPNPPNLISLMSQYSQEDAPGIDLPLGIDKEVNNNNELPFTIVVTGLAFNELNASLNAVMVTRLDNDSPWVKFGSKQLCVQPNGFSNNQNVTLSLLSDVDLNYDEFPITLNKISSTSPGTYVSWDCNGFDEFYLDGNHSFNLNKYVNLSDNTNPVVASFTASVSSLKDVLAEVTISDDFSIVGVEDFQFSVQKSYIDLSTSSNLEDVVFPNHDLYKDKGAEWTGFFIEDISMTLPSELQMGSDNSSVNGHNLIIDGDGLSGTIGMSDFLSGSTNAIGDWGFSLDYLGANFLQNSFQYVEVDGNIDVPLIDEAFNYTGQIMPLDNSNIWRMTLAPNGDQTLNISALKSSIELLSTSVVTVDIEPGISMSSWKPYANLDGSINLDIGGPDFDNPDFAGIGLGNALSFIEGELGIDMSFDPPSMSFSGFKINHPALPSGMNFGFDEIDANFTFIIGGVSIGIDDVDFIELPDININPELFPIHGSPGLPHVALPAIGLQFKLGGPGINFDVDFWGKQNLDLSYSFGKIEMDYDLFSFSCSSIPLPATTNLASGPVVSVGDDFKVGGFTVTIDEGDVNKGTISIPYLPNSNLQVLLENVQLNNDNELISGSVTADRNLSLFQGSSIGFGPDNLPLEIPILSDQEDVVIDYGTELEILPFSMVDKIEEMADIDLPFDFLLSGIEFTPTGASLDVVLAVEMDDKVIKFGAKGLDMTPQGLNLGNIKFYLLESINVEISDWTLSLDPTGVDTDGNSIESFVTLSCNGLEDYGLVASYAFDPTKYKNIDNTAVTAQMNLIGEEWGEFIGTSHVNVPFYIEGFNDFVFTLSNASVDLSKNSNLEGVVFPNHELYQDIGDDWTGFFIEDISMSLPSELHMGSENSSVNGHNLIIDGDGLSGTIGMSDFLSGSTNIIGDWGFALDYLGANFLQNSFQYVEVDGSVDVPLIDEAFNYTGQIMPLDNSNIWRMSLGPNEDQSLTISALKSSIELLSTSVVTVDIEPGISMSSWKPYANLDGSINLNIGGPDFDNPDFAGIGLGSAMSYIEGILGVDMSFNPPSMTFSGFKINHPELPSGMNFGFDEIDANFTFNIGGVSIGIDDVDFIELPDININPELFPIPNSPGLPPVALPAIGLQFKLGGPGINFDVDFWGKQNLDMSYSFGKIEMDYDLLSFSCSSTPTVASSNQTIGSLVSDVSSFKVGGFTVNVDATDDNKGTISIPYLPNSNLHVLLNNVELNSDNELISGTVIADRNLSLFESSSLTVGPGNLPINVPLLSDLDDVEIDYGQELELLPFSLVEKIEEIAGVDMPFDFLLSGIEFGSGGVSLDVVLAVEMDDKVMKFGAKGLKMTPGGVNLGDIKFYLLESINVEILDWTLSLEPNGVDAEGKSIESFVTLSCNGLEDYGLVATYAFDPTKYKNIDGTTVIAQMNLIGAEWGEFIGTTHVNVPFYIEGFNDFIFTLSNASVDLSKSSNLEGVVFPNHDLYKDKGDDWTGFFIEDISMTLPSELQMGSYNSSVNGHNLIIDGDGLSGTIGMNDFLSGSTNAVGDWGFTLDFLGANFLQNSFQYVEVDGSVDVPLIDEAFNYTGQIMPLDNSNIWRMSLGPNEDQSLTISALKSSIELLSTSIVTVDIEPGISMSSWKPYANLDGSINLNIGGPDFDNPDFAGIGLGSAMSYIEGILGVDMSFNPPSMTFSGFKINHPELPSGMNFGFDEIDANFTFNIGGVSIGIDDVDFIELPDININPELFPIPGSPDLPPVALPAIGLQFKLGGPGINFDVDFWGKQDINLGYSFGKIEMDYDLFSFSCSSIPLSATTNLVSGPIITAGSTFKVGGFTVNVDATDVNKGRISIPYLPNSNLHVLLNNVQLNNDYELINGTVTAGRNLSLFEDGTVSVGPSNLPINVPILSEQDDVVIDYGQELEFLPFSMVNKIEEIAGIDLPFDFLLSGIEFTSAGASLDVVLAVEMDDKVMKFGAKGLEMTPGGVNLGAIKFYLLESMSVDISGWTLILEPNGVDAEGKSIESFVTLSCNGLEDYGLVASYAFDPTKYKNIDNTAVMAQMNLIGAEWGEFIGTSHVNVPFYIEGFNDFIFTLSNASVDLSTSSNLEDVVFPNHDLYKDKGADWTGFFIEDISMTLPSELQMGGGNSSVNGHNLIIDGNGLSGTIGMSDFLSADEESKAFGNWAFSVDTFQVNFITSIFDSAYVEGNIRLPLLSEDILYEGGLTVENSNYIGSLKPRNDMKVGMGFGPQTSMVAMTVEKESKIELTYSNGNFKSTAQLCGMVEIDLSRESLQAGSDVREKVERMESILNTDFSFWAEMRICLDIDPSLPKLGLKMFDLISFSGEMKMFDLPKVGIPNLNLLEIDLNLNPLPEMPPFPDFDLDMSLPDLPGIPRFKPIAMNFDLPNFEIPFIFNFWLLGDLSMDFPSFDYELFEIIPVFPSMTCTMPATPTSFVVSDNSAGQNSIRIPFLNKSFPVIELTNDNYETDPLNQENIDFFGTLTFKKFLNDISSILPESLDVSSFDVFDLRVTGFTFRADALDNDNLNSGLINLDLHIGDQPNGPIISGSIPIHAGGIVFDGIKFGPGSNN